MKGILLTFFFALSIVLLLSPTVLAQNADVGIEILEMQLVSNEPILVTPGGEKIYPDKYNSPSNVDTRVAPDKTPTCEEIFTIISKKQARGEALSQFDQAMRARCIDPPPTIPDDDEKDVYTPELSLAIPEKDTLSLQVGKTSRIELEVSCCPQTKIPDCPTCVDRPTRSNPDVTRATQSVNNRPQPTHPTQPNVTRSYNSTRNHRDVTRPTRPPR